MLKMTFLGTGDTAEVPVFGCECAVCADANNLKEYRRSSCSVMIQCQGQTLLIDCGISDMLGRFKKDEISAIIQTHYHGDHAQGLLHIRWGIGKKIPVFGPEDEEGFADLYKHPGILDFQKPWQHGQVIEFEGFSVIPVNLTHSKPTLGYIITTRRSTIAYLTDTVGLPDETIQLLKNYHFDYLILDCTFPPQEVTPRNHNDLNMVMQIEKELSCDQVILTHISHHMDLWLRDEDNRASLPDHYSDAKDNMSIVV